MNNWKCTGGKQLSPLEVTINRVSKLIRHDVIQGKVNENFYAEFDKFQIALMKAG